jgi:O-antigen/teichoic acid export membrane protein
MLLRAVAAALAFALGVATARALGAAEAGLFFLSLTLCLATATLGRLGLDVVVLRTVASGDLHTKQEAPAGLVHAALWLGVAFSAAAGLGLCLSAQFIADYLFEKPEAAAPLRLISGAALPLALCALLAAGLQGALHISRSVFVTGIAIPAITTAGIAFIGPQYGATGAAAAYLGATCSAVLAGWYYWRRTFGVSRARTWAELRQHWKLLCRMGLPLCAAALLQIVIGWGALVMLGFWRPSEEAGVFGAAMRVSALFTVILAGANAVYAPRAARLFQARNFVGLKALTRNTTVLACLASFPFFVVVFTFPAIVMDVFGDDFAIGAGALVVLSVGQVVNIATGPATALLLMSSRDSGYLLSTALAATAAVLLGAFLIPDHGITGAAITSALTCALQNGFAMAASRSALRGPGANAVGTNS